MVFGALAGIGSGDSRNGEDLIGKKIELTVVVELGQKNFKQKKEIFF